MTGKITAVTIKGFGFIDGHIFVHANDFLTPEDRAETYKTAASRHIGIFEQIAR